MIKIIKNPLAFIAALLLIPSLILNFIFYQKIKQTDKNQKTYLVKQVLDGDTFVIQDNIIVRLFSVGAPELKYCGGEQAKKELEKLILGKRVSLEVKLRDSFGRQLAIVQQDNNLINKSVLESGWFWYNGTNYENKELLKAAYYQALTAKIGIFSSLCTQTENPQNPKCSIKGNISKDNNQKIYHFPGCGRYEDIIVETYRGEKWFCSEEEVMKAGFVKSKNCFDKKYKVWKFKISWKFFGSVTFGNIFGQNDEIRREFAEVVLR